MEAKVKLFLHICLDIIFIIAFEVYDEKSCRK